MNRLNIALKNKSPLLSIFLTAGFPRIDLLMPLLKSLENAGVGMIEIGLPFSDPIADGPTIQAASNQALAQGMTLERLFSELNELRTHITVPVYLMGYTNPVFQFGFEKFVQACARVGVDGLILPDLPLSELEQHYLPVLKEYAIDIALLVTERTSPQRLHQIASLNPSFIYAVSGAGTTGLSIKESSASFIQNIRTHIKHTPVLQGFGISSKNDFNNACANADGAIIGTAFIKALQSSEDPIQEAKNFVKSILDY